MSNIYVGGGKSGAFGDLTVNGEITSPASQITISSTIGGKSYSYTKTLDASGQAVFKGLLQGTWDVTMTDGTQTATDSIVITTGYNKTLSYQLSIYYEGTSETGGFGQYVYEGTPAFDGGPKVTLNASDIYMYSYGPNQNNPIGAYRDTGTLDLSQYSTVEVETSVDHTDGGSCYFTIQVRSGGDVLAEYEAGKTSGDTYTRRKDIITLPSDSRLSNCFIRIYVHAYWTDCSIKGNIYSIIAK